MLDPDKPRWSGREIMFWAAVKIDAFHLAVDADLTVVGSGPGGYVAAIKAAQLGFKVGIYFGIYKYIYTHIYGYKRLFAVPNQFWIQSQIHLAVPC